MITGYGNAKRGDELGLRKGGEKRGGRSEEAIGKEEGRDER